MKFLLPCLLLLPLVLRAEDEPEKVEAAPAVETVVVHQREFHPETVFFGTAASPPNASLTVTIPVEAKVQSLLVHLGQSVKSGDPLVEIEPPLDFQIAQRAAEMTAQSLDSAQKRFDLKLLPLTDLLTAKQAAAEARLRLAHFLASGLSGDGHRILATAGGIVAALPATPGDTIAAAEPLAQMIVADDLEVRGGLPTETSVETGQAAKVTTINRAEPLLLKGEVQSVSRALNAETHLLDVSITLLNSVGLHPGESLRVAIPGPARTALLVPKTALRSEEGETLVFTIKDGKAVRHEVELGSSEGDDIEVTSGGLADGDSVVTTGNSQLSDGMGIETSAPEKKTKEE